MEITNFFINNRNVILQEQNKELLKKIKKLKFQACSKNALIVIEEAENIGMFFQEKLEEINREEIQNIQKMKEIFAYYWDTVEIITKSDLKSTSHEIKLLLEEYLNKLKIDPIFLVTPSWQFNYAVGKIFVPEFYELIEALGKEKSDRKKEIINFSYSLLHKDNILLTGIIPHEFGHYIDLFFGKKISEQILSQLLIDKEIIEIFKKNFMESLEAGYEDEIIKDIILRTEFFNNYIEEIVADVIGVLIGGRASYLAGEYIEHYYGFESNCLKINRNLTHPNSKLRNFYKYKILDKKGLTKGENSKIEKVIENFKLCWERAEDTVDFKINQLGLELTKELFLKIESYLEKKSDLIIEEVEKNLLEINPELIYSNKDKEEQEYLLKLLEEKITPNELKDGTPANYLTILNAGWIKFFDLIDNKVTFSKEVEELNLLLKKGIELADIHRRWNKNECHIKN